MFFFTPDEPSAKRLGVSKIWKQQKESQNWNISSTFWKCGFVLNATNLKQMGDWIGGTKPFFILLSFELLISFITWRQFFLKYISQEKIVQRTETSNYQLSASLSLFINFLVFEDMEESWTRTFITSSSKHCSTFTRVLALHSV